MVYKAQNVKYACRCFDVRYFAAVTHHFILDQCGLFTRILHDCFNECIDMMPLSNGNIFRVTGPLCGEFTGPRWIPPIFVYAWINGWVNNGKADALRRHRSHCDITVMEAIGILPAGK